MERTSPQTVETRRPTIHADYQELVWKPISAPESCALSCRPRNWHTFCILNALSSSSSSSSASPSHLFHETRSIETAKTTETQIWQPQSQENRDRQKLQSNERKGTVTTTMPCSLFVMVNSGVCVTITIFREKKWGCGIRWLGKSRRKKSTGDSVIFQ